MVNYYQILGLPFGASSEQVRKAYREYAKHYHPDKHQNSIFFKERFQEMQAAYETLSDDVRRQNYHQEFLATSRDTKASSQELKAAREKALRMEQLLAEVKQQLDILQVENTLLRKTATQTNPNAKSSTDRIMPSGSGGGLRHLGVKGWAQMILVLGFLVGAFTFFQPGFGAQSSHDDSNHSEEPSNKLIDGNASNGASTSEHALNSFSKSEDTSSGVSTSEEVKPFPESFEKAPDVTNKEEVSPLATGKWFFKDAFIDAGGGNGSTEKHFACLKNLGRLSMRFDAVAGVRRITISSAAYGQDGPSTWELWLSRDGGRTFARTGAPVVTSGSTSLPHVFAGVANEPIRIEIRKTSNSSSRLRIDSILLETATGPAIAAN